MNLIHSRVLELRREEIVYYPDSRDLVKTVIIDHGKSGSEQGVVYEYDKLDRKISQTDALGNKISFEYDPVGNLLSTSTPLGITENYYNHSDRLTATITPNGEETQFDYDRNGNLNWSRDPEKNESQIFYDALNRKISTLDPLDNLITYDYDANSNLLSLTDRENQTTYFKYDAASRKVLTTRPMGQTTEFVYDKAGNLKEFINAEQHKTEYTYNCQNQPVQVDYYNKSDLTTPVKTVTFDYDTNGNLTGYDDSITFADYTYDGLDRKIISTVDFGPFSKTFSNSYPDNWTQAFTSPDNLTTTFQYDQADRLITASHETAGQVQYGNYLWNLARTKTYPGATINYGYDLNGRLASINALDGLNTTLLDRQYFYTQKGDLQSLDAEHGSYTYDHDALSRLTNVNAPTGFDNETYTYDGAGNRLTSSATSSIWQYNKNNELINQDGTGYTCDATGNIITRTGSQPLTFLYDEAGRLIEVQDGTSAALSTYYYDPFGRRLWKETGGTNTYYLYSDQGLIAEYDTSCSEIRSYGYLPGTSDSIAPLYMKTNGSYYWYHKDHLGTPQQLVNDTGAIVWEARYTGFGKASLVSLETETIVNNFRLPGQYFDSETGLHYNGNRYYDPDTGRYLRTDPLGLEGGLNLYVYALNNPLRYTDPDGLVARNAYNSEPAKIIRSNFAEAINPVNLVKEAYKELKRPIQYVNDNPIVALAIVAISPEAAAVIIAGPPKSAGQLGREGEALASKITGAPKNTQKFSVNGRNRIPDQVQAQDIATRQPTHVTEVKNVQKQSLATAIRRDSF